MSKRFTLKALAAALCVSVAGGVMAEPKQGGTLTFIYRLIGGHFNPVHPPMTACATKIVQPAGYRAISTAAGLPVAGSCDL